MPVDVDPGIVDSESDDVTEHLLESSSHLPPIGAEQVFEAEVGGNEHPIRERSKLTREERIKQARAKRQDAFGRPQVSASSTARPRMFAKDNFD